MSSRNHERGGFGSIRQPKSVVENYDYTLKPQHVNPFNSVRDTDYVQMPIHGLPSHVKFEPNYHRDKSVSKHVKPPTLNLFSYEPGHSSFKARVT